MSTVVKTEVTQHDDGTFCRTALIVESGKQNGSVDILDRKGNYLARINIFVSEDSSWLGVDVIDTADNYDERRALTFVDGKRCSMDAQRTVAADFRRRVDVKKV